MANGDYLIAIYIVVPVVLVLLLLACVYVCTARRYKLNWYEQSLLEQERERKHSGGVKAGVQYQQCGTYSYKRARDRRSTARRLNPVNAVVEVLKSLKKLSTRLKTSSDIPLKDNENRTEWIVCSTKTMGSSPSSPVNEHADQERFWVPPAVLDRKRAQSLVPATTHHNDSEEEVSSGTTTPASLGGTREFAYTFPSAPLISSDGLPSPLPPHNRQRRASMQDAIDFRKIDSKLYDRRSLQRQQSVASIEEEQLGSINFSLDFNNETNLLTVYLNEAENLVSRDFSGTADPYCKVCLLPDKQTQLQSKIHRKTTNPIFDEEFIFEVLPDVLHTQTLELLVYDYDQFSRHECIGQVKVPFENVDFTQRQTMWKGLVQKEQKKGKDSGDLIFSLGYLFSAERLTVVMMKARNLRHSEDGKITMAAVKSIAAAPKNYEGGISTVSSVSETQDPYVKVSMTYGNGKKVKKKKTSTKHNVFTPVWNEALNFSLPREHLQNVALEFTVYHDNKMGNDEILGKTKISRESEGDEKIHWDELISGKSAVARWHALSPL